MTGYGRAAAENETFRVAVSARSVNHRFLDLVVRVAEDYREVEPEVRKLVDRDLARGRVELRVAVEPLGEARAEVVVDEDVARAIRSAAEALDRELGGGGLSTADLLRLPEVVRVERRAHELSAGDRQLVLEVVASALDELVTMRRAEGEQLEAVLAERLDTLRDLAGQLAGERAQVSRQLHANMRQRLQDLLGDTSVDEHRLAQETALLAEKIDIQEELDRLTAHLDAFAEALSSDDAVGRRLDFLAQEIHRELNTLGVKCRDSTMAQWAVEAKLACEQLREQVQNVE